MRSAVDHFAASLQSAEGKLENAGNTGVDVCVLPLVPIRIVT